MRSAFGSRGAEEVAWMQVEAQGAQRPDAEQGSGQHLVQVREARRSGRRRISEFRGQSWGRSDDCAGWGADCAFG